MGSGLVQITNAGGAKPTGPQYWRSLNQLEDSAEFHEWVQREFPSAAAEMLDGNSRRTMLKLMAASFGLAGLAACRRPEVRLAPKARVEETIPGAPYYYTSAMVLNGHAAGVVVETFDGRPTKIEGNPDHPASLGAATAIAQASVLGLYDPDRSKSVLDGGKPSDWDHFVAAVKALPLGDGTGLRFLSEPVVSPTLESLRGELFKKYPKAGWIEFDSISRENEREGTVLAFGQPLEVHPQFDKAKVILALDYDFLGADWPTPLATKLYTKRRRVETEEDLDQIGRLYAVESQFSLTGANADHRLRMRGGEVAQFAKDLSAGLNAPPSGTDKRTKFLAAVIADLKAAGREALVVAGPRQPAVVHALAHQINQALGTNGATVTFTKIPGPELPREGSVANGAVLADALRQQVGVKSGVAALKALADEMTSGQVSTLVIVGGNPAYTAPADLPFTTAMSKVANTIHLGIDDDETAAAAKWHVPEAHYLEAWGDARSTDGAAAIQQPMIEPLYGGKSAIELVALLLGSADTKGYDIVKKFWTSQWPEATAENTWRQALNDGVLPNTAAAQVTPTLDAKRIGDAVAALPAPSTDGLEVGFMPGASTWDGRFANNAWMQEAPNPITKLVWDNAILISPAMQREKKWRDGDIMTLAGGGLTVTGPVMTQPGHADNAVTVSLGYGRPRCGDVARGVGFNAGLVRSVAGFWYSNGFTLTPTGAHISLASTQEHGSMEEPQLVAGIPPNTRPLYREGTVDEYKKNPKFVEEMQELPELHSIYPERVYDQGYQWGMAIDLGACTGCNACVVACQAENNIPVVGRDQIFRGREMHWIRMDRYYVGSYDDPRSVEQPVPCMQCENAPCENVCPVAATSHSPEGLNDMAYNRCVGTRYCLNNCPYKVRHFNFLDWHKNYLERRKIEPEVMQMMYNPDVTVRMRGVMEKCTYCVQRIQEARITAKTGSRSEITQKTTDGVIKDGDVQTACQQTCPANAIVFGNINDPESRVTKLKKQERNYAMLAELDVKPRTTYLARLRNPNPELEA
jgi:MoCo/4Fe-4S cofactor protein with predicted Tat translocation signal